MNSRSNLERNSQQTFTQVFAFQSFCIISFRIRCGLNTNEKAISQSSTHSGLAWIRRAAKRRTTATPARAQVTLRALTMSLTLDWPRSSPGGIGAEAILSRTEPNSSSRLVSGWCFAFSENERATQRPGPRENGRDVYVKPSVGTGQCAADMPAAQRPKTRIAPASTNL